MLVPNFANSSPAAPPRTDNSALSVSVFRMSRPRPAPRAARITSSRRSATARIIRSEEHTSELQSRLHLVCRLLLEKKKKKHSDTAPSNPYHTYPTPHPASTQPTRTLP